MFASNFLRMLALMVVFMSGAIQQGLSQNVTVTLDPSSQSSIVRYRTTNGGYDFVTHTLHSIGRHDGTNGINSGSTEDIYRQQLSFSLTSIPTDAQIQSATIIGNFINTASPNLYAKITASSGIGIQQIWTNIASGTTYFSDVSYSNPNLSLTNATFNTAVGNAVANGVIYLGVMAQTENNNLTYATTNFRLRIVYTPRITVTVQNSFGGGTVKVDGNTVASGTQFSWLSGSCHTLEATNQPPNNFTTWFNVTTGQPIPGNPITVCPTVNTTYQANFSTNVSVTIRNSFGGGFIHVDGQQLSSPVQQTWLSGSSHTLLATNQEYGGYYRVFNYWRRPNDPNTSQNPLTTTASTSGEYVAQFERQFNITVSAASYIEGGSGGTYKVNGTNVGETWSGTFVENMSQPITLEAVPPGGWVLTSWSDGSTVNPRTIVPTNHTSLRAKYKLHLASTSAEVTAFSTQRKIVRDRYGAYHMVYESARQIWYTRSTDEGATWSPELNITGVLNDPEITNRWPSVAYVPHYSSSATYDRIFVVWEAFADWNPQERSVVVCELDIYGVVRSNPVSIDYWNASGPSYPAVVGVMNDGDKYAPNYYALVGWYDGERGMFRGVVRLRENVWSSPTTDLLLGVTDFSLAPLTLRRGLPAVFEVDTLWHLAYVQNNNLMYASIRLNSMGYPEVRHIETVAMGYDGVYMRTPSVAVNNRNVVVSWQEDYWEFVTGAIRFSERIEQDDWTNPVGWLPTWGYYQNPTIAADNLHDRITVAWQDAGSIYGPASFFVQRGGGGADWGGVSILGAGTEPTLAAGMPGSVGELAATRTAATVQRVNVYAFGYPDDMRTKPNTAMAYGGGVRMRFSQGVVHAAVLLPACNGQKLTFPALSDTTRIGTLGQLQQLLLSNAFEGTGTLELRALFSSHGQLPNAASLAIVLRDRQTGELLRLLHSFTAASDTLLSLSVPLSYGTRRVVLALAATNFGRPRGFELERWFEAEESSSTPAMSGARTTGTESLLGHLPRHYALHGNHPNPFNPSTTIKYDLPEASHVSLVVYDVLGRKVAEIAHGNYAAGYHSATWNASSVASGIYFARFTAADVNGNVKLSKVTKLLLAK